MTGRPQVARGSLCKSSGQEEASSLQRQTRLRASGLGRRLRASGLGRSCLLPCSSDRVALLSSHVEGSATPRGSHAPWVPLARAAPATPRGCTAGGGGRAAGRAHTTWLPPPGLPPPGTQAPGGHVLRQAWATAPTSLLFSHLAVKMDAEEHPEPPETLGVARLALPALETPQQGGPRAPTQPSRQEGPPPLALQTAPSCTVNYGSLPVSLKSQL